jgi:hypothetical protein
MWVKYLCRMDDARLCRADFYCSSRLPDVDLVGDTGRSPPVASFSSTDHCHVTNNSDIRIANAVNKSLGARVTKEVSELVHENDKLVGRENRPDEVHEERRLLTSDRLTLFAIVFFSSSSLPVYSSLPFCSAAGYSSLHPETTRRVVRSRVSPLLE